MTLKPYQGKIIALLTQQELLIAEIYRFFSGLYPDLRDFWNDVAKEQLEFATWMEYLSKKAETANIVFQEDKIKTYTVESFIKYLQDNIAKVKLKAPNPKAAFSLALSIENSLLVKKSFDHFQSSDHELSALLATLREKRREHRQRIEVQGKPFGGPVHRMT